jgi:hypothetical protein
MTAKHTERETEKIKKMEITEILKEQVEGKQKKTMQFTKCQEIKS